MTNDIIDLLQIKIEKAKANLPVETANATAVVDWKAAILGLREKKGYSFEQLGDLELETELLLCGLVSPEKYPQELETRMKISKAEANEMVNIMNEQVFAKIRAEMIKNTERKKIFAGTVGGISSPPYGGGVPEGRGGDSNYHPKPLLNQGGEENQILTSAGSQVTMPDLPARTMDLRHEGLVENREDILKKVENPEPVHPILAQKLSGPFQTEVVETEHSLNNISKKITPSPMGSDVKIDRLNIDPYREHPE